MKQLTCEVCGGNDLLKQDGAFVCQSCGCKYSAEEVKKLMVQISDPVKVEGIQSRDELYKNIKINISFGDYECAENTIKEYQRLYPDDYRAWLSILSMCISKINNGFEYTEIQSIYGNIIKTSYQRALMIAKDLNQKSEIKELYKKYVNLASMQLRSVSKDSLKNMFHSMECTIPGIDCAEVIHVMCGFEEVDGELFYVEEGDWLHNYRTKVAADIIDDLGYVKSSDGGYILSVATISYDVPKFNYNNYSVIKDYSNKKLGTYNSEFGTVNNYKGYFSTMDRDRTLLRITSLNENELIMSGKSFSKIDWIPQSNRKKATPQKSGCYIATAVYGSYDCPEVWTLRRYRDYTLAQTWYGRAFIRTYYAISPTLVKLFGHTYWFLNFWKNKLDRMVCSLKNKGFEDKPYDDRKW